MLNKKQEIFILNLLVLLIPYQYYLFDVILKGVPLVSEWRDLVCVILLINILVKALFHPEKYFIGVTEISVIFLLFFFISCLFAAPKLLPAIAIGRVYIITLLFLVITKNMSIDIKEFMKIIKKLVINAGIISVWGLFQAFFLGDQFLKNYIFVGRERLDASFYIAARYGIQRVNGTFVSPNFMGLFLSIVLLTSFFAWKSGMKFSKSEKLSLLVSTIALIGTMSRSSWLITLVPIIVYYFKTFRFKNKLKFSKIGFVFLVTTILFYLFDKFILDGIMVSQLIHSISYSISGSDPSANFHLRAFTTGAEKMKGKLLYGLGLGTNGPRAATYYSSPNLSELSYYVLLFEFGIIGTVLYLTPFLVNCFKLVWKRTGNELYNLNSYLSLAILFSFIFLPYVQDLENMILISVLIGSSMGLRSINFSKCEVKE